MLFHGLYATLNQIFFKKLPYAPKTPHLTQFQGRWSRLVFSNVTVCSKTFITFSGALRMIVLQKHLYHDMDLMLIIQRHLYDSRVILYIFGMAL
jgi:hypothetical protein